MAVASGTRPYGYEREAFTLQNNEVIGYSGILFEEPMFVLTAERAMYATISLANRKFTKYFNKTAATSEDFEPRADGKNLDGSLDDAPGCVNFSDYISDLRTALSGLLMNYITEDIDYSGFQAVEDYFHANSFPGQYALGDYNWTHPANDETPSGLGTSGNLFDIDLKEVQYQPYTRAAKYYDGSGIGPEFITPIFPSFISRAGAMVRVSATDENHAQNLIVSDQFPGIVGSGYSAVRDSDEFIVAGDGFVVGTSRLRIGYDLMDEGRLDTTATGTCQQVEGRQLLESMGDNGFGYFSAPALSLGSGIYGFHVFDPAKSGLLGIWPPIPSWRNEEFEDGVKYDNNAVFRASGVHVFNEGMWSSNSSGTLLMSPFNGARLWQRYSDQESYQTANMTSARRWSDDTPSNCPGSSDTLTNALFFSVNTANPLFKDEYYVFARYNKNTGALISATENGPYTIVDPLSAVFVAGDMSDHSPHDGGISIAGYTYCNAREGSDNFLRCVITDGTNPRGSITPSGFGTAEASPELVGTIGGTLMGASTITQLTNPYRMYGLVVDQTQDVFPLPVSSGTSTAGQHHSDSNGTYEIMMEQELGHKFEDLTSSNFSPANNWRILKGQGDFSGRDFMVFNAKPKGETNQYTFLGEVQITASGGSDIVEIIDMIGPFPATPNWIDDFTT